MKTYVSDIKENESVESTFLVKEKASGITKMGSPYLKVKLGDRSGEMEGRFWNSTDALAGSFQKDDFVLVRGRALPFQEHLQLNLSHIQKVEEGEVDLYDFLPMTMNDVEAMFESIKELCAEVKDLHLSRLLQRFWEDETFVRQFKTAPASKWLHHTCLGGLLEHTLSLARLVLRTIGHYEGLNKDLLLTGAILHDLGKVTELSYTRSFDYSDEGRLLGHILLGIEMVEAKVQQLPDFPKHLSILLKHLLLSHHGQAVWGSPKKPMTLEAVMLHYLDDMDAKLNGIQQFVKLQPQDGPRWTSYHRAFEQAYYLPDPWGSMELPDKSGENETEK